MTFIEDLAKKLGRPRAGNEPKAWSPYGHEAARRELLMQRRILLVMIGLGLAILYAAIAGLGLEQQTNPMQQNLDVGLPPEQKPITVRVNPGGVPAFSSGESEAPDADNNLPGPIYEKPSKFMAVVVKPILAILGPLAVALLMLNRVGASATGKLAELNLGIYKGAMPYEMHAAGRAKAAVFTHREVDGHVFGKERTDYLFGTYLNAPPAGIEHVFGDASNDARVERLRHKRAQAHAPAVAHRAPTPAPARVIDARRPRVGAN